MRFQISGNKRAIFWMHSWCWMPQILNTCEHNREITNYLQFLLQNRIQKWIARTAEGLPCLLFSSFAAKHILVCVIKSCQPPFSVIICFVSIARALLHYFIIAWIPNTVQQYPVPIPACSILWLSHSLTKDLTFAIQSCRGVLWVATHVAAREDGGDICNSASSPSTLWVIWS